MYICKICVYVYIDSFEYIFIVFLAMQSENNTFYPTLGIN